MFDFSKAIRWDVLNNLDKEQLDAVAKALHCNEEEKETEEDE